MKITTRAKRITAFIFFLIGFLLFASFLLPELVVLTLPFIIAFVLAKLIEPLVVFLNSKLKLPRKIGSAILVFLAVSALVSLVVSLGSRIIDEITYLVSHADDISGQFILFLQNTQDFLNGILGERFSGLFGMQVDFSEIGNNISGYINAYIGPAIEKVLSLVKSLPNILLFTVVLILGTYFISSDNEKISLFLHSLVPEKVSVHLSNVKKDMSKAFFGYVRAQLLLMCITFFECTVGFLVIGGTFAKYALLLGLTISIIDMFPVLGTGTVLIPWGIYSLITGDVRVGVSLLILYGICLLVRQLLEPRIVGKQIGLHPLATLMTMYAGLRLIGVFGMILGPVLTLIIKNLADSGVFKSVTDYLNCKDITEEN